MNFKKIKRAIISVSDKSNLKIILPILKKFNVEIISSGKSFRKIKEMKYDCIQISNYTGFSEMLDGRIKTLHPKIHAGILNIRKNKKHKKELKIKNIPNIDLVIVDLYPLEQQLDKKKEIKTLIEYIDIGGPALIRSAAKNFNDVTVLSNISDYYSLVKELKKYKGSTSIKFRKFLSAKAFSLTAYYDSVIANWMNDQINIKFPYRKTLYGKLTESLRYGENPHQQGKLYSISNNLGEKIHGKTLSYNNYNDIYTALTIMKALKKKTGTVIIKHANPCGVSEEKNKIKSFQNAIACDPISAFGAVVGFNFSISKKLALEINKLFFDVVISRGFNKGVLRILKKKKNIRLIDSSKVKIPNEMNYNFLGSAFLMQNENNILTNKKIRTVTIKKPSFNQLASLKFAFNICKFVKSNAIVLANGKSTIGIGSGQPSRLDSCKIASSKALQHVPEKIINSVAASDAFFPFPDGIKELIRVGVKAIIQPGGSINDKTVIREANKEGIVMVFTGNRHFKH